MTLKLGGKDIDPFPLQWRWSLDPQCRRNKLKEHRRCFYSVHLKAVLNYSWVWTNCCNDYFDLSFWWPSWDTSISSYLTVCVWLWARLQSNPMNPLSEFRSLFANSKKETSTKRKKYKKEESFKLSSPRAESARAVTGRRCPHSGRGEDFFSRQPDFFTERAVTPERKVEKWFPRWKINRHAEG